MRGNSISWDQELESGWVARKEQEKRKLSKLIHICYYYFPLTGGSILEGSINYEMYELTEKVGPWGCILGEKVGLDQDFLHLTAVLLSLLVGHKKGIVPVTWSCCHDSLLHHEPGQAVTKTRKWVLWNQKLRYNFPLYSHYLRYFGQSYKCMPARLWLSRSGLQI